MHFFLHNMEFKYIKPLAVLSFPNSPLATDLLIHINVTRFVHVEVNVYK